MAVAELDVTGALTQVALRRLGTTELGKKCLSDDATGTLSENAGLRHARGGDVANRVDTREPGLKRCRIDRNVAVLGDSTGDHHIRRPVFGHTEEEVVGKLGPVVKLHDAALAVNPRLTSSLYGRGLARQRNGAVAEGERDIANAKALDPNIAKEFAGYGVQ